MCDIKNNVFTLNTVQIQPMRSMVTALRDNIEDATMYFTQEGWKIINLDKTESNIAYAFLYADKFDTYICEPEKIIICVNTTYFFKLISTTSNTDVLTMYIKRDDFQDGHVNNLYLEIKTNEDIKTYELLLLNAEVEEMELPVVEYGTVIHLSTNYFQKIIRDTSNIVQDRIEIKSIGNNLTFSYKAPWVKATIERYDSKPGETYNLINGEEIVVQKQNDESVIIQGEYSLKTLNRAIKCTPLCSHLELCMEKGMPLTIQYKIGNMGEFKLFIQELPPII